MRDLIERIEAAEGPSRELDAEIAKAVGAEHGSREKVSMESRSIYYIDECAPAYTASLDAAMTLVPEGFDWAVFRTNGGLTVHAWCGSREDVFAATPALALCAAALRAKEQSNP